ncbi:MAG: xanthan lyase, partial [bacterium]|nr:xanthan lyase [bacterium]
KAPKSGKYELLMAYSAHESRAKNVSVTVRGDAAEQKFSVDQTKPHASGKQFSPVGVVTLKQDAETTITVSNKDAVGFVIVDAIQLLPKE